MKRLSKSAKMRGAIFALLLAFTMSVAAQVQVRGTVLDERGEAAIGAMVQVDGTNIGAAVGFDGTFTIPSAPQGGTLVITFVGYREQRVPVSANIGIIRLVPDETFLEEVVVIGFGTGRSLSATAASVTRVSGQTLQNRPVANVMDALQGQVPGLQVFTSSGEPAAISTIRLFGSGSLSAGTMPLIVVDGMPIETETLRSLNPLDFESVTVLRDASATSIYGSRAANGVIFITTRRGLIGERATIRVSSNFGFSTLANTDFFDSVMTADQYAAWAIRSGFHPEAVVIARREEFPWDTQWRRHLFRDRAPTNTQDISISGGAGRTNFFLSAGRTYQQGVFVDRSRYERLSFRSNLNTQVNTWLRTGINISVSHDDLQQNTLFGAANANAGLAFLHNPMFSPIVMDPDDPRYGKYVSPGQIPGLGLWHPRVLNHNIRPFQKSLFLNTVAFAEISPITGLTLRSQVGWERMDRQRGSTTLASFTGNAVATGGAHSRGSFVRNSVTYTNTAEYRFTVQDDHNLTFLGGTEFSHWTGDEWGVARTGYFDDRLMRLESGTLPPTILALAFVGGGWQEWASLSFFGRAEYDFQERIFFNTSLRNDASSRFGRENRNALFWSAGTMWHLHREHFIQDIHWLNTLTARLSVGTSGNSAIGNYDHLANMGSTIPYQGGSAWTIATAGNPRLGWEHQTLYTFGLDLGFLDNRLRSTIELYNRISSNMLVWVPQPRTTGFVDVRENVARMANRGISFRIDGDVIRTRNAFLTPYVNFNFNREEVTELFHNLESWVIPNTGVGWIVGQPRMQVWPIWAGVNPENGRPQWYLPYRTTNAFGQEINDMTRTRRDPNYVTSTFDMATLEQNTGQFRDAPINGGFGLNAGFRGFQLQMDFTYSIGGSVLVNESFFAHNPSGWRNLRYAVNDFWTPENREATFPAPPSIQPLNNWNFMQFDSRLVENTSFVRLKNLTLGYTIPRHVLDRTGFFTDARVFVTGRNLLTFTNFTGFDPELDTNLTMSANPATRQFSFGFDLAF